MNNKEKQLQGLVRHEAKALRRYATKTEIENLSFEKLDPSSRLKCIYGQMTGTCDSPRAIELIQKCASRVFESEQSGEYRVFSKARVNGSPIGKDRLKYFSPIEMFIETTENRSSRSKKLIEYIKGETNELNF